MRFGRCTSRHLVQCYLLAGHLDVFVRTDRSSRAAAAGASPGSSEGLHSAACHDVCRTAPCRRGIAHQTVTAGGGQEEPTRVCVRCSLPGSGMQMSCLCSSLHHAEPPSLSSLAYISGMQDLCSVMTDWLLSACKAPGYAGHARGMCSSCIFR